MTWKKVVVFLKIKIPKTHKIRSQYFETITWERILEENAKRKLTVVYLGDRIMSDFNFHLEYFVFVIRKDAHALLWSEKRKKKITGMIERCGKYRNIFFPSTERKDSHAPQGLRKKKKRCNKLWWKPRTLGFCSWLCGCTTYQLRHIRQNPSSLCLGSLIHKKGERDTHKLAYSRGLRKHECLFFRPSPRFQNPLGDFSSNYPKCKPSTGKFRTEKWTRSNKTKTKTH